MMVSLDGYFEGVGHDLSWHNADNPEFQELVKEHATTTDAILMGHRTYDLMVNYWPSYEARQSDPITADFMTTTQKYAIAHTAFDPGWANVTVIHEQVEETIRGLKNSVGKDIAIFGSNELTVSLLKAGLVDEFRIMVNPVAIGAGTPLFNGIDHPHTFTLKETRKYTSGNTLLIYSS